MSPANSTGGLRLNLYREMHQVISSGKPLSEEAFNDLALRLFRYQLSANSVYRGYFDAGRFSRPDHWSEIPALPATAFKRAQVRCFPAEAARTYFQTSGTTESESGRHFFETLEIYESAILPPFKRFLLPDKERMRMEILTPPPSEMPHSSLIHMMETVRGQYGTPESSYHLSGIDFNFTSFADSLQDALRKQQPVFLLGTAFGFVNALEEMARQQVRFNLPFGSRIMETGGFKGRVREIARPNFYQALSESFGIPAFNIVNEYGMTELSSQFYDRSLMDQSSTESKGGPEWTRVMSISPDSGIQQPYGTPGLLRIIDLANVGSVIALQTEDVGICHSDGTFQVLGRVGSAAIRGCSLTTESLLT